MGFGQLPNIWKDQPVYRFADRLDELVKMLPIFDVRPFEAGASSNQFYNQIVRMPTQTMPDVIPVGIVSKSYHLLQHIEVIGWLRESFKQTEIAEDLAQCTLVMSTYGERMLLWVALRGLVFDPGDSHPLQTLVSCQNSVDGSCAFEIKLIYVRAVCSNGMVFGPGGLIRKAHLEKNINPDKIADSLRYHLRSLGNQQVIFSQWLQTRLQPEQINHWVNQDISLKWGSTIAARVAGICRNGYDGKVCPIKDEPPSHWSVGWEEIVPGACAPVENIYHAAQALSWVASHQKDIDIRQRMLDDIPGLIQKLKS